MKKRTFLLFIGYIWTKTLLGLVFTPYQSVKEVSRRTILLPTIFSPLLTLLGFFVIGRIFAYFYFVNGIIRDIIALTASAALISILLWQALLLYLLFMFFLTRTNK